MISYDKKTRHLIVSSGEAVTFDIQLRGRINVVRGAAATGKTYMCNLIRNGNPHPDVVVFERGTPKNCGTNRRKAASVTERQAFTNKTYLI